MKYLVDLGKDQIICKDRNQLLDLINKHPKSKFYMLVDIGNIYEPEIKKALKKRT